MADEVREVVKGDGYALGNIEGIGEMEVAVRAER